MQTYQSKEIRVDADLLIEVLDHAKKQTADITIIPRFLNPSFQGFEIAGVNSRTLVVFSEFSDLGFLKDTPLWSNETLPFIACYSKDIPAFTKNIRNGQIHDLYLDIHSYVVNGFVSSIAVNLFSKEEMSVQISSNNEERITIIPSLPLVPYGEYVDCIRLMQYKYEHSTTINTMQIDMKKDEDFKELWAGTASNGASAWIPDASKYGPELRPYIVYIAKCMFTFSKSDFVFLQINNAVEGERSDVFIAKFIITRKSKGNTSTHSYLTSGIRLW